MTSRCMKTNVFACHLLSPSQHAGESHRKSCMSSPYKLLKKPFYAYATLKVWLAHGVNSNQMELLFPQLKSPVDVKPLTLFAILKLSGKLHFFLRNKN